MQNDPVPPVTRLLRLCDGIALAALAVLFAVVAVNVAGRALFDATGQAVNLMIPGAIEVSRYAMMVMVLAALPRAAEAGLVRVDLLIARLPAVLAGLLERLWALAVAAFAAAAGWLLLEDAALQATRGDVTQDLELPLWLITGFAGLALAALALTGLWLAARRRR
ncbi:MAG TPA: TRAP transporter small permease subunit [Thermohalobaculum sp.]|nr:TRAP transporter small permease subunit [Thermohalobaculum sp.]